MKRKIAAIVGIAAAGFVYCLPIASLSSQGQLGLGILIGAIIWWIFKVFPDYVTALIMSILYILLCNVSPEEMFKAFSQPSLWLLFSSFVVSLGISKSGLMTRIALYILKAFPTSFSGQSLGLICAGTILGPFIPNMSAKAAILAPISHSISKSLGYADKGKQATGLFLSMLTGLRTPGPVFISASVLGYGLVGLLPQTLGVVPSMGQWLTAMLPWFITTSILNYILLIVLFRPRKRSYINKTEINRKIDKLGPMSKNEWKMLFVTMLTMLLWVTEELHGIPSYIVSIAAMCLTIISNIFTQQELYDNTGWGALIYMGIVLGLSPIFSTLGISEWLVALFKPFIVHFSSNSFLLILCIALVTILLRFIITAELATLNILMIFLVPLAVELGINPWILGITIYAVICPWFFLYQNPVYIAAHYAVNGEMEHLSSSALYCTVYLLISIAGLLLSVPFWISRGLFFLPS